MSHLPRLLASLSLGVAALQAAEAIERATITDPGLDEISGIVAAHSHDGYWVHNDSGDLPRLYAIDRSGRRLATVRIDGAGSLDWEDLAAFELAGRRYLVAGDIGDNHALLPERALYVIEEPAVDPDGDPLAPSAVPVAWTIRFRYQDGPRDAEGLAVDPSAGRVLVLSKRSDPATLYRLPLRPEAGDTVHVAHRLCVLPIPEIPRSLLPAGRTATKARFPTALDISSDGRRLLVTTLVQALVYTRTEGEAWADALQRPPLDLDPPALRQPEAACFDRDQDHAVITSEDLPAPLLRIAIPRPQP